MEKRRLGQSSLEVPPITLGCNVFGWTADEKTSFELLDAWLAAGFNFLDTADVYARWVKGSTGGDSETIIGKWLKARGNRDKIVLATKLGIEMPPGKGLSRAYMQIAVEESLRRLQTDYIDLYQSHRDDPDTPIEETLSAYADLIKAGKVREIGASNFAADRLAESLKISSAKGLPRYQSLQPQYSLVERGGFEGPLEDLCLTEKLGVIGYYSLASGFLTGKYRSRADMAGRARGRGVEKYLDDYGFGVIKALDEVAARYEAKPGQIALAWLIARPSVTAPIASVTTLEQVAELAEAAEIELDAESIAKIDTASKPR
jgi:aryl-alcohol dehydrogenase-like predicted oxidoreductase